MKNSFVKAITVLLVLGLMLFVSCKHAGFPVKKGAVQVTVEKNGESSSFEIPIALYDVLEVKFSEIADKFNSDAILSKQELNDCDQFSTDLYNLDVFEADKYPDLVATDMASVVPVESIGEIVDVLTTLTPEKQGKLSETCEMLSDLYDVPYYYLKDIAEVSSGEGWANSKDEVIEYLNTDKAYLSFIVVVPQIFPNVQFIAK